MTENPGRMRPSWHIRIYLLVFMLHKSLWAIRFFPCHMKLVPPLTPGGHCCRLWTLWKEIYRSWEKIKVARWTCKVLTLYSFRACKWGLAFTLATSAGVSQIAQSFPCRNETCSSLTCVKNLWFCDTELDQVSHGLWLGAFFLQFWKKILYNRSNFTTLLTAPKGF